MTPLPTPQSWQLLLTLALCITCFQSFSVRITPSILSYRSFSCVLHAIKAEQQQLEPYIPYDKDNKNRINEIVSRDDLESVRIRHIKVNTKDMAEECKRILAGGSSEFSTLAISTSICEHSKFKGGDLGWHSINTNNAENSPAPVPDHNIVGPELINAAYFMNIGDMKVVASEQFDSIVNARTTFYHVVQLVDVVMKLSPTLKKRRQDRFLSLTKNARTNGSSNDITSEVATVTAATASTTPMTYHIDTMGCQMNVADSERMEGQLRDLGYNKVVDSNDASLVILNTCAIREHAETKVYSYLGPHALRKRSGEDLSIIVAGCVAQQEGEDLVRRFPEVDVVMGPQYTNRMSDLLEAVIEGNQVVATDPAYQTEDSFSAIRRSSVTAFVNVIYGCNERCTYCVVPTTRGVEQSRTIDAIVGEVQQLVAEGYKEVTLLGQNIDSWGR